MNSLFCLAFKKASDIGLSITKWVTLESSSSGVINLPPKESTKYYNEDDAILPTSLENIKVHFEKSFLCFLISPCFLVRANSSGVSLNSVETPICSMSAFI